MSTIHIFRGNEQHCMRAEATRLRMDVFVREQKVPMLLEIDARDFYRDTVHFVVADGDSAIAVARLLCDGPCAYHVGRVAVAREQRRNGIGYTLLEAMHSWIAERLCSGDKALVTLEAQEQATGFYQRVGYDFTDREPFFDAGIRHREMIREITCRTRCLQ